MADEIPSDYKADVAAVRARAATNTLTASNQQLQRLQRATNIRAIANFLAEIDDKIH